MAASARALVATGPLWTAAVSQGVTTLANALLESDVPWVAAAAAAEPALATTMVGQTNQRLPLHHL